MELVVTPAVYTKPKVTNLDDAVKAWNDGKDFLILRGLNNAGRYCSNRDVEELQSAGVTQVSIMFNNDARLVDLT